MMMITTTKEVIDESDDDDNEEDDSDEDEDTDDFPQLEILTKKNEEETVQVDIVKAFKTHINDVVWCYDFIRRSVWKMLLVVILDATNGNGSTYVREGVVWRRSSRRRHATLP